MLSGIIDRALDMVRNVLGLEGDHVDTLITIGATIALAALVTAVGRVVSFKANIKTGG